MENKEEGRGCGTGWGEVEVGVQIVRWGKEEKLYKWKDQSSRADRNAHLMC